MTIIEKSKISEKMRAGLSPEIMREMEQAACAAIAIELAKRNNGARSSNGVNGNGLSPWAINARIAMTKRWPN